MERDRVRTQVLDEAAIVRTSFFSHLQELPFSICHFGKDSDLAFSKQ
jgi:hypothetical protein